MTKIENDRKQAIITKYIYDPANFAQVKAHFSQFVENCLSSTKNIMAEVYLDDDKKDVIWLIQRWEDHSSWTTFSSSAPAERFSELIESNGVSISLQYFVTDTEPLSKEEWRKPVQPSGEQFTLMLILQALEGTQDKFQLAYHKAMPAFRDEEGVITYQLSVDDQDKTQFLTYEKFRNQASFDFHLSFPPINPIVDFLKTSIKAPPFQQGLHRLIQFAPQDNLALKS